MGKYIIFFIGTLSFANKIPWGLKYIFIVFFLLLPLTSQAAVIDFGAFSTSYGPRGEATKYNYSLVFKSINPNSTIPIDCADDYDSCDVEVSLFDKKTGTWWYPHSYNVDSNAVYFRMDGIKASTVGELEQKLSKFVGTTISGLYSATYEVSTVSCIALTYSHNSSVSHRIQVPGSPCTDFPLTNTVCKFDNTPSINYGVVNSNNIEGNKKSVDLNIGCSGDTTVDFTLNSSSIDLSGGIVSNLSLSKEKAEIKAGNPSVVTVTSILHSSGKAVAGNHVNSAILYAAWQ
ncbi:hypothetical protein [Enterobacter hormaechei]|uniref:hypothetical protein n=1 Tax=Enterobacter hormaechei TaxID=158836 RepID=UPI0034CD0A25